MSLKVKEIRTALITEAPVELINAIMEKVPMCEMENEETKVYHISIVLEELKGTGFGVKPIEDLSLQGYDRIEIYKDLEEYNY